MYEAIKNVVGKDMTTRNHAKSYVDINLKENIEVQHISIENEGECEETLKEKETSSSSAQKRHHRNKHRMHEDNSVEKLPKKIEDVEGVWECGSDCFSNSFSCRKACQ